MILIMIVFFVFIPCLKPHRKLIGAGSGRVYSGH